MSGSAGGNSGDRDALSILAELIRCPSVTPDAGAALDVVEKYLTAAGFECHRLTFEAPGTEPVDNLFARLGTGRPHLCFAGHADVVPPGDQTRWSAPPFAAQIRDGRIVGRGAEDMKGAVAAALAAALELVAGGTPFNGSLSFLITGDEEGPSVNGTRPVLEWMAEHNHTPDECIVGEPTNTGAIGDAIKVGRRGALTGTLVVTGEQGHSAYPERAANPIRAVLRLIDAISTPLDTGTEHFAPSNLEVVSIDTGNPSQNTIPAQVSALFNVRFNDRWTAASLEEWLRAQLAQVSLDGRISWQLDTWSTAEVFVTAPGGFVDLVRGAIKTVTGMSAQLSTAGGTSDARFVTKYCPVVEFGLVGRSMHQIDEHVPLGELEQLTAIYRTLMERYFSAR